jgi:IS30 family transposase
MSVKNRRLTKAVRIRIVNLVSKKKFTYREIAKKCKVSPATISRLVSGTIR